MNGHDDLCEKYSENDWIQCTCEELEEAREQGRQQVREEFAKRRSDTLRSHTLKSVTVDDEALALGKRAYYATCVCGATFPGSAAAWYARTFTAEEAMACVRAHAAEAAEAAEFNEEEQS